MALYTKSGARQILIYQKNRSSVKLIDSEIASVRIFALPFWDWRFSPQKFWASLGGLTRRQTPHNFGGLMGVATSPGKEVEISFCSVLRTAAPGGETGARAECLLQGVSAPGLGRQAIFGAVSPKRLNLP